MSVNDLQWWEQAACTNAGPTAKHEFVLTPVERYRRHAVISNQLDATINARRICATCPVTEPCLAALWDDPYAVAGGTVPAQRLGARPAQSVSS